MLLIVSIVKKGWIVMKTILLPFFLAAVWLAQAYPAEGLKVVYHKPYTIRYGRGSMKPYTWRISAIVPAPCQVSDLVRSANTVLPGDFFWPSTIYSDDMAIKRITPEEKKQIALFLKDYFPEKFQDSTLIDSAQSFTYRCMYTPDSVRHEFYLMLSEGDTIYVISGWFGKFMSLFRASPYDKRLTPADFIAQAIQIAPRIRKLSLSDQMVKVDTGQAWEEKTYFLQAYEISNHLWLRHYPISVVLPPDNPKSAKEKVYNLIEISKIYDQALFHERAFGSRYR